MPIAAKPWIVLTRRPGLELPGTLVLRSLNQALKRLRQDPAQESAAGLLVDADFNDAAGNAWAAAFAVRELFPSLPVAVIHDVARPAGFASQPGGRQGRSPH
jgi:hypothetical protein